MPRSTDWSTITVGRVDVPEGQRRFTGRVLVDSKMSLDLIGSEPARFVVEPGEHTVTIFFKRRPVIFQSGRRRMASTSVSIQAGEQAELVCGIRPEVVRRWNQLRRGWEARSFALMASLGATLCFYDWAIASHWRETIASLAWYLPDHGMLIPLCYRLPVPLVLACCCAVAHRWLLRRWAGQTDLSDVGLLSKFGSPYYIEATTKVPGVDP